MNDTSNYENGESQFPIAMKNDSELPPVPPEHEFNYENEMIGGEVTDDEDLAIDYNECKELYDDLFPFENYGVEGMSIQEKFDKDVVTPFLFGRLVSGSLSVEQAKRLGDLESRRKLYRELTSLFQADETSP
jgi:hypothetical protein